MAFERSTYAGRFSFEVDDLDIGFFTKVSGLEATMEEVKHIEGGENGFEYRLPGRITWPNIVLERGLADNDNLFGWMAEVSEAHDQGKVVTLAVGRINLHDSLGEIIASWWFDGALPVKWSGPQLAAGSSEVAMETLEISHRGFKARDSV